MPKITSRSFPPTWLAALCLALSGGVERGAAAPAAEEKPIHFVVFLADDLGYGDLGCFGHPVMKTPNLDRFATEGVKLTQCYSASSVCSPSRSAILTGRTPYRNGVFTWIPGGSPIHLRRSEVTVASLLKAKGYATCHVGKWHLNGKFNSPEQPQPDDHGYDWWLATQNNASPSHENPRNFVRNGEAVGPMQGFSAVLVVEEAIRWLEQHRDPQKPFFLTVWTHEPHLPIESDPRFQAEYADLEDPGLRQHHGNVTQIDHAFGRLMEKLDDLGVAENTFVIFTSDNGPEGNGQNGRTRGSTGGLRGRKRSVYEGGIRVPGIVRWPGRVEPGSECRTPIIGSDIFATVCEIAGVSIPGDRTIDGASMLPAFAGKPIGRQRPLYWRWYGAPHGVQTAMRQGDWKVVATEELDFFELYNLAEDRSETTDLAGSEPERLEAMKKALVGLNAEIEREGPDWWQGYGGRLRQGVDETSSFDTVRGCKVTKGELGYVITADGEGFALRQLEKPITDRAVFRCRYKTLSETPTRNGFLVFGAQPRNRNLIKCGTAIGMETHAIFRGGWNRLQRGALRKAMFEPSKTFDATVEVDIEERLVKVVIDGEAVTQRLPRGLAKIEYYGYYVKDTRSTFSPIEIEPAQESER